MTLCTTSCQKLNSLRWKEVPGTFAFARITLRGTLRARESIQDGRPPP